MSHAFYLTGSSVGGLHKSMTRLGSSQQINVMPSSNPAGPAITPPASTGDIVVNNKWGGTGPISGRVSSGGVTVTTISPPRMHRPHSQGPLTLLNAGVSINNSQVGG